MSPWTKVADTFSAHDVRPLKACNQPFTTDEDRTYPRAGVRRRAGKSVLIIWLGPGVPMLQPDLEGRRKYEYPLTDHQEAIELGQMLVNFERIGRGESR